MMYNYPFFSPPSFNYHTYIPHKVNNSYGSSIKKDKFFGNTNSNFHEKNNKKNNMTSKNISKKNLSSNISKENINIKKEEPNILFEIFGLKLYFDDVLLICLIFFLYNEGVKDDYLFIALILLLLS